MTRITTLLVPLLLSLPVRLPAQEKVYVFEHFTDDNVLPENSVRTIMQDYLGFLWFGTTDGLVRYDGYNFEVYQPGSDAPSGGTGSRISAYTCGTERPSLSVPVLDGDVTHFPARPAI